MDFIGRHDDYEQGALREAELDPDPFRQFVRWLADAEAADLASPNAMVLTTVGPAGPTSRTVLLKDLVGARFEFVTNGTSRKGRALAADGRVSLLFPWYALERQVLVDGTATAASDGMSDRYWASRPRGSQLAAWASDQSQPIASRDALEGRMREVEQRLAGAGTIPRPPHWGAWLVEPARIEFWQGRPSRLHDRLVFTREPDGWRIERLQP
ncbi:pyridoxamine 5'-phosphate oxidase [Amnibacterium sp.]|uniref:pyridoxamine 5'-phosphate oxidase n=1 Tax=Amnibacterium sp. TaxID=1872496 RepID=UPI002634B3E2|nr:pyridoxamine 5'-phosphate oxidase [Amnibacterium sp.]